MSERLALAEIKTKLGSLPEACRISSNRFTLEDAEELIVEVEKLRAELYEQRIVAEANQRHAKLVTNERNNARDRVKKLQAALEAESTKTIALQGQERKNVRREGMEAAAKIVRAMAAAIKSCRVPVGGTAIAECGGAVVALDNAAEAIRTAAQQEQQREESK